MYVNQISTNYSEIPTMTVEMPFQEFVTQYALEVVSRNGDTAIVRAEWGNGDGYDEFRVEGIETVYAITTDLIESAPATLAQAQAFAIEYDGWMIEIKATGAELRMYATRDGSDDNTPSRYSDWEMVTPDYGYLVIGRELTHAH